MKGQELGATEETTDFIHSTNICRAVSVSIFAEYKSTEDMSVYPRNLLIKKGNTFIATILPVGLTKAAAQFPLSNLLPTLLSLRVPIPNKSVNYTPFQHQFLEDTLSYKARGKHSILLITVSITN